MVPVPVPVPTPVPLVTATECIAAERGYWSFKLCLGQNLTQFHNSDENLQQGGSTVLGRYNGTINGVQQYTDGDTCPGVKPPLLRQASVIIGCGFRDRIDSIREPSTCRYVLRVQLQSACIT